MMNWKLCEKKETIRYKYLTRGTD